MKTIKPPLKWAGGKRWLLPYIKFSWYLYQSNRLVEPFCGGLATTLGLLPINALLNDINPHLINFYRWLQIGLKITIPMQNNATLYYAYRKRFNDLIKLGNEESKEAAELFYYLNRTCYNGLCRFNQQGKFNVPFGQYKQINYAKDFNQHKHRLASWEFKSVDFEKLSLLPDDFVYADPPYDVEFTQYSKEDFTWNDQVRLAHWLSSHTGPVILSNQATHRIIKLYRSLGFQLQFVKAPRRINCTGNRKPETEVIATRGLRNSPRQKSS